MHALICMHRVFVLCKFGNNYMGVGRIGVYRIPPPPPQSCLRSYVAADMHMICI